MPGLPFAVGWPLVEDPRGRVCASLELRAKTSRLPPEREDALFERGEADLRVHRLDTCIGASVSSLVLGAKTRPRPRAGTRRWPRGTTPLAGRLRRPAAHRPPHGLPLLTGGARLRLLRERTVRARFGQRLGEDVRRGRGAGLPPSPARSCRGDPGYSFPSSPMRHATPAIRARSRARSRARGRPREALQRRL